MNSNLTFGNRFCATLLALVFCLGAGNQLIAQEETAPADTLLPSLAPKEVEIQGELEFNFPELRRPALTGFNPPPPVFEVPVGRRPFVENYKQTGSDLPASILRKPEPPAVQFAVKPVEFQGYTRIGYGRYGSSDGIAAISIPLGSSARLNVEGDHFGYRSFSLPNDTSSSTVSRFVNNGRISLNGNRGAGIWGIEAGGMYNRIDLNGYPKASGLDATVLEYPDRETLGLDVGAWIESGFETTVPYAFSVEYEGTRLQTRTRVESIEVDPRLRRAQKAIKIRGKIGMNTGLGKLTFSGSSQSFGLDTDDLFGSDHRVATLNPSIEAKINRDINAQIGLSYLGFKNSGNFFQTSDELASENKLGFLAVLEWFASTKMKVYLKNEPRVKAADLREMLRINPYQDSEPIQMAEHSLINSTMGLDFYAKRIQLDLYGGFESISDLQTYSSSALDESSIELQNPQVYYIETADILKLGSRLNAFITGSLSLMGSIEYRSVEDIPYFPALAAQTRLSFMYADGQGHFVVKGGYVGSRMTDLSTNGGTELPGFINMGLETSYFFSRNLGFYAVADNLSNSDNEYWSGYFQPSFNVFGGLRFRW